MKPNVRRAAPVCEPCARAFFAAFSTAEAKRPPAERQNDEYLRARARIRAQAVRLKDQWCCPRCTKLPTNAGQEVFLDAVYPPSCRPRSKGQKEG